MVTPDDGPAVSAAEAHQATREATARNGARPVQCSTQQKTAVV
jgi:hypothetical protein